jgi:N-formylglutamate amidohydrolase
MTISPVNLYRTEQNRSPLVIDSPHSGRDYPDDFRFTCPLSSLRQAEDFAVDELIVGAETHGATVITANFPRSYIDLNRAENDIDPAVLADRWDAPFELTEKTPLGLGLVRRLCMAGVPVYDAPLTAAAIRQRIHSYYRPYHNALAEAMRSNRQFFGVSYLIDCHSMPSRSQEDINAYRADFILGDREGTSCDPSFTRMVKNALEELGYSVALNEPYKGMEIIRRHGNPALGLHALQLEINRRLYMDERRLEKHLGFDVLRCHLQNLLADLAKDLRPQALPMAAE